MKIFLVTIIFLSLNHHSASQTVNFSKKSYLVSEAITALVTGDLIGISSDIKKSSYISKAGNLDLGSVTNPGFYRLDFKFKDNATKSYLLGILKAPEATTENTIIQLSPAISGISNSSVDKVFNYFKHEKILGVTHCAVREFSKKNTIALLSNLSFCISTISGQPVIMVICRDLTTENAQELGLELIQAFVDDMKAKDYLNEQEFAIIKAGLTINKIGSIMGDNCSKLFQSLTVLIDNPDLKIAFGYFERQCKTTVIILDRVKLK
jgi:hypothetical protein